MSENTFFLITQWRQFIHEVHCGSFKWKFLWIQLSTPPETYGFSFIPVMQFDMKNIDAQLLKHLESSSQCSHLMFQRKYNWCSIGSRQESLSARLLLLLSESSAKLMDSREFVQFTKLIITINSFGLWMGLPSFNAHSCSPLRYSQSPSRDFPEADIIFNNGKIFLMIWQISLPESFKRKPTAGLIGKVYHRHWLEKFCCSHLNGFDAR